MTDLDNTVFFIHTAEVVVYDATPNNIGVLGLTAKNGYRYSTTDTKTGEVTTKLILNPNKHAYKDLDNSADFSKEVKKMLTEAGYNLDTLSWEYNRLDFSFNFLQEDAYLNHLKLHGLMLSLLYAEHESWKDFYETYHKFTHEHQNINLKDACRPHRREYEYYNKPQEQEKQGRETDYTARYEVRECNLTRRKNLDTIMKLVFNSCQTMQRSLDEYESTEKELVKYLVKDYEREAKRNVEYTPVEYARQHFMDFYTRNMAIQFFVRTGSDEKQAEKQTDYIKSKHKGEQWIRKKDVERYIDFLNDTMMDYCNENIKLRNGAQLIYEEDVINF